MGTESVVFRPAREDDLEAIVRLHEADEFGHGDAWNETNAPLYRAAFARIASDPGSSLWVAEWAGEVAGTFQLQACPVLTGCGRLTIKLESVQVREDLRSKGIGARMVAFAEEKAREAGADRIILSSNTRRKAAHRFYERLGYECSHVGFRKALR